MKYIINTKALLKVSAVALFLTSCASIESTKTIVNLPASNEVMQSTKVSSKSLSGMSIYIGNVNDLTQTVRMSCPAGYEIANDSATADVDTYPDSISQGQSTLGRSTKIKSEAYTLGVSASLGKAKKIFKYADKKVDEGSTGYVGIKIDKDTKQANLQLTCVK